ncbi:MAG: RNA polymerase sigma factor, partial [Chloroflexota bacterium]|nr:RNA polymerase sigma factor [Chloroflexota bacterium]
RLALGILGNSADALDASQEALISAWRSLGSLRDSASFDPWLRQITVNAARMVARKRHVRDLYITHEVVESAGSGRSTTASIFDRAFDRLSVEQRAILLEHHLEGRSVVELANDLAIPLGTVKSRLHTARQALDRALREMDQ